MPGASPGTVKSPLRSVLARVSSRSPCRTITATPAGEPVSTCTLPLIAPVERSCPTNTARRNPIANVDAGDCISCCPYLLLSTGQTVNRTGIMYHSSHAVKLVDLLRGCRNEFKSFVQPLCSVCFGGELSAKTTHHRDTEDTEDAQRNSPRHLSKGLPGGFTKPAWLAVLLAFVTALTCQAQNPSPATQQRPRQVNPTKEQKEPDDVLRIDTDLVSVDATVTDLQGRTVRSLRQKDFKLFEDGIEQPLAFFHMENKNGQTRPLAIVFALDISGSMTPEEIDRLRGAMHAFSEKLADHPAVFAVMTFGMHVKTLQRFTNEA